MRVSRIVAGSRTLIPDAMGSSSLLVGRDLSRPECARHLEGGPHAAGVEGPPSLPVQNVVRPSEVIAAFAAVGRGR